MLNPISAAQKVKVKISFVTVATRSTTQPNTLVAVGNDIDTKRISGKVDVVAGQIAFQDVQGYWAQPSKL